ncbi:MAG TPA: chloride channel protein [Stellaceae bacterium]|nr:chloride channel protein [Stellaceae bacterium]
MADIPATRNESDVDTRPANATESRLRDSDVFLILLAGCTGVAAGFGVLLVDLLLEGLRWFSYDLPPASHLSDTAHLPYLRLLLIPVAGGVLVGIASTILRRWRPREVVDAIEANALFGGRMSLGDSVGLVAVTLLSGGFGASVGLEAAYTQLGAAMGSRLGRQLSLRRDDVRTLVGCGAAGAIAAAFNAPLAGAFYAFELIVGSYTLQTLAPIGMAALVGALTVRVLNGGNPIFVIYRHLDLSALDYMIFFVIGLAAAGLGMLVMQGVTHTEALFRRLAVPRWGRPALGGAILGCLSLAFPQILGSGHGAILRQLHSGYELPLVFGLIVAKTLGSAISIGSGFRGGLFSSSLLIGSLFGNLVGEGLAYVAPTLAPDPVLYTLVGMGAVAAAIIGAPVTMIMLVLETTGDFSATIGVMVGVLTAASAVRHWFGYSFATWRFHLRGLKIRSPEDIGWLDELKIGPIMRRDPAVIAADQPIAELLRRFPPGSTKQVFVADSGGQLSGAVDPAEAARPDRADDEAQTVGDLINTPLVFLLPGENLRTALGRFSRAAQESLPVIDDPQQRRIIGYVSEAYVLRRYAQELERRRSIGVDDAGIFSPTTGTDAGPQAR